MKKSLLFAAAACAAMSAFAQDDAVTKIYAVGDFCGWSMGEAVTVELKDGAFTTTLTDAASLKFSTKWDPTSDAAWSLFDEGCITIANITEAGEYDVVAGAENINLPWKGDWTFSFNSDLTKCTLSTTTPKPEGATAVYVRGAMNDWGAVDAWAFTSTDGVKYQLLGVEIPAGVEFKVADANWSQINYGLPEGTQILLGETTVLEYNGSNITIDYEDAEPTALNLYFELVEGGATLLIESAGASGIEDVTVSNAAPVYYNLQGVKVANPQNGLFIVKQGSSVKKVIR